MTTIETVGIVLFDDDPTREDKLTLLRDLHGYEVTFVDLNAKPVVEEVKQFIERRHEDNPPNLILVDHILDKAVADSIAHKGASIVPILRETWPEPPVIGISAAYEVCVQDISSDVYDDVFPIERLSELVNYIPSIIAGYQSIRGSVLSLDDVIRLLDSPPDEVSALHAVIPSDVKESIGREDGAHHLLRWFRRTFHREAGFLLDKRWTAIMIGVSDDHFDQYEPAIESARYAGIFAENDDPRWWKAKLYSAVLPESTERFGISLQKAAKAKFSIPDEHSSKCYRCGDVWPEVLGYVDEASVVESEMQPLHLRCSQTHPDSVPAPYFQERRIMLEGE